MERHPLAPRGLTGAHPRRPPGALRVRGLGWTRAPPTPLAPHRGTPPGAFPLEDPLAPHWGTPPGAFPLEDPKKHGSQREAAGWAAAAFSSNKGAWAIGAPHEGVDGMRLRFRPISLLKDPAAG